MDTTATAELDVQLHSVTDADLASIHRSLANLVHSNADRSVGPVRIREIAGFDVVFLTTREDGDVVITIGAIQPPSPEDPIEKVLEQMGVMAKFRGAMGL